MEKRVIEFCSGCGKCPVLEVSKEEIILVDHEQSVPGRVTLTRQQAKDLVEGLKKALEI